LKEPDHAAVDLPLASSATAGKTLSVSIEYARTSIHTKHLEKIAITD
jgi:hypothetical protein